MRAQLHGSHRGSQEFGGSLEAQAFLPEEPVGRPLELGKGIEPLLDAPREPAGVQEIIGGVRSSAGASENTRRSTRRRRALSMTSRRAIARAQGITGAPGMKDPRARCMCRSVCCIRSSAANASLVALRRKASRRGAIASYRSANAASCRRASRSAGI
jgi:hypothetical protein